MKKNLSLLLIAAALLIVSCGKELESNNSTASNTAVNILAGSGIQGYVNGTDTSAYFNNPTGVAVDASGNVYVADYRNNAIRKITQTGVVTTLAGNGSPGSVNGTGSYASFDLPTGVATDAAGNIYVADSNNNLIREISPSAVVTTFAGSGAQGLANGTGTAAVFNSPQGVAVDAIGNVYVADNGNNLIRKISAAGVVTTLAGNGTQGATNGLDTAATFYEPTGVATDASGNVYVADYGNNLIRKVGPSGNVTTFAGSGAAGSANGMGTAASFNGPAGIAIDATGNIYVADYGNNLVREISPSGMVTSLGSVSGSAGTSSLFYHPYGIAVDVGGNIYVANYGNSTIQKINK